jgi:excisionase family DNA binding protein
VLRLINDGELTAIGLGRMRRVPHAEIEAYIERNRREVP